MFFSDESKRGHLHFHQKKDFQNLKARFNIFKIVFRNSEARLKPAQSQKRKRSLFIAEYNREPQKKQLYPGLEQHWQPVAIRVTDLCNTKTCCSNTDATHALTEEVT